MGRVTHMKSFGNPPPEAAAAARDNDGKSARSAEYTLAGALIGVCVIGGGAAWWLTRDSNDSASKPATIAIAAAPSSPAAVSTAPAAEAGANWQSQLQQEISKIDREQQQEQNRADANQARLAELQRQRDDLERERQKLAAQAKAAPAASSAQGTVASARPVPDAPAKPKVTHIPARIELNTCASPRYPDLSRQLNEEGRVIIGYQIDEYGKVLGSRIDKSSGSPRLDSIAERALAKCKFAPGTANGVSETSWMQVAFTWKLN